jgi:hypothetical protein
VSLFYYTTRIITFLTFKMCPILFFISKFSVFRCSPEKIVLFYNKYFIIPFLSLFSFLSGLILYYILYNFYYALSFHFFKLSYLPRKCLPSFYRNLFCIIYFLFPSFLTVHFVLFIFFSTDKSFIALLIMSMQNSFLSRYLLMLTTMKD